MITLAPVASAAGVFIFNHRATEGTERRTEELLSALRGSVVIRRKFESNLQLFRGGDAALVALADGGDDFGEELIDLLRRAAY